MSRRRNKNRKPIRHTEIAVFTFSRGSQFHERIYEDRAYDFVKQAIDIMMKKSFVESDKVGISGYKEDVISYIAGLIHFYTTSDLDIELMDDLHEYDPDMIVPNKFY